MNDFTSFDYAQMEARLGVTEKQIEELANKVSDLENKLEWVRLYGFSRNVDDD